ncbi:MAG: D-glucuronyl C5-epimerase family protein [Solirubrobacteraceae bacterium]
MRSELTRLMRRHAISSATYSADNASFNAALAAERHLTGTRRAELTAVTETLHQIAAARGFIPSRLPALFETLDRNRQWWTRGPLLAGAQRVEFAGSQLVWEYYPGQGIQIQVLGSFGKANGLYESGVAGYGAMQQLLGELIPLAARRGGGVAWEYYFHFDGGSPPWTSAMSQATGLQALSNAYLATRDPSYLQVAASALPLFSAPPPTGVKIPTSLGTRYLQYTFAPTVSIINAFLQTLIGLDTYARVSGNQTAARLFAAGNAEAMAEVPTFDTGAWSLYQPGLEDDLSYHQLVTGFLAQLCKMTKTPVYCTTAQHFQAYLKIAPVLRQLTGRARKGRSISLRFQLSKASHVGVTIAQGSSVKFLTSASFPYGRQAFTLPPLRRPGTYKVRLAATDLAGNYAAVNGTLRVTG